MVTTLEMYLLTRCDAIRDVCCGFGGFFGLVMIIAFTLGVACASFKSFAGNGSFELFSNLSDEEFGELKKGLGRWRNRMVAVFFACAALSLTISIVRAAIPTNKEMAAIIVVPAVANSEPLNEMAGNIVELANAWLKELAPAAKEK